MEVAGTLQTGLRLEPRRGDATATKKTDVNLTTTTMRITPRGRGEREKEMEGAAGEKRQKKREEGNDPAVTRRRAPEEITTAPNQEDAWKLVEHGRRLGKKV